MKTMTESSVRLTAVAAMLLWLSGCGLKGDLYVPEKQPANQAQSEPLATPAPADAGDEQNDDETTSN